MLRRLSAQSQHIVEQAQEIARGYEQGYVDGEHLLLAIAEGKGNRASEVLRDSGGTPDALRKNIEGFFKEPQADETFVVGRLPGTMHFRNVVARAIEIAENRKAGAVEPEHLLLALCQEKDSLAVQAMTNVGLDEQKVQHLLAS